jgi:hypothetical protein
MRLGKAGCVSDKEILIDLFNRPFSAFIDASGIPSEFDFHRGAGVGKSVARERSFLNAAIVFKVHWRSIRRHGDRILPDRLRHRHGDHHHGSGHWSPAQYQIQLDQFIVEITGQGANDGQD